MALINQNPQQIQQVQPAQSQGPQKPQGTGFTNLQQIIQANRNNRLGQTIGQGIQNQASQVKSGIQNDQQQFGQGLQKSQDQLKQDQQTSSQALNQIAQNYSNQPQQNQTSQSNNSPGPVQSSLSLPGNFTQTFQRLGQANYTGPQGLQNYDTLQAQAQNTENLGNAAIDPNARQGLLQRFVGGPQYSQGQQRLDNLLLGQTAGNDLSMARRATQGLQQNVTNAQQQAGTQVDLQKQALQRAADEARGNVGTVSQQLDQNLQNRVTQAATTNQGLFDRLKDEATKGKLQGQDLAQAKNLMGLTDDKFVTDQDIADALGTFDPTQITKQSVANQDDLSRARALESISNVLGQNYSSGLSDQGLNQYNETAGINPLKDQLTALQTSRSNQYNTELDPLQKQLATYDDYIKRATGVQPKNASFGSGFNTSGMTDLQRNGLVWNQEQRQNTLDALNKLKDKYNYYGLEGPTEQNITSSSPYTFANSPYTNPGQVIKF